MSYSDTGEKERLKAGSSGWPGLVLGVTAYLRQEPETQVISKGSAHTEDKILSPLVVEMTSRQQLISPGLNIVTKHT